MWRSPLGADVLAIITTHPIQYQTPIWQALAADGRVPFEVWYLTDFGTRPSHDREFGKTFSWDIETLSGYPHHFLKTADGATPVDFWQCRLREDLRDRLRASAVKAVWLQGWQVAGYWQAIRAAKAVGARVWLRGESNDLAPTPSLRRVVKRALLGHLFSNVDRFFYIGSANKRLYEKFGASPQQLLSAPYAVDNERFAQQAAALRASRARLRRDWNIAQDALCVLFCGKMMPKKRPLDLIKAAQLLRSTGRIPNIHLLFVGSGELDSELRAACSIAFGEERGADASAGGLSESKPPASFAGFLNQTEIPRAYVVSDCLVLPSDHGETWGLVVNEALASGLPCIASDACGCAEDLLGIERSFPLGDVASLANKIQAVCEVGRGSTVERLPSFSETISAISKAYFQLD
jgi:glycosyltransferase involved in cell wall biosynthesis